MFVKPADAGIQVLHVAAERKVRILEVGLFQQNRKNGGDMDKTSLNHKKPWQKPELIVLVRSNPEEAVLTVCKNAGAAGPFSKKKCNRGPGCSVLALS